MKSWKAIVWGWLMVALAVTAFADDGRFSLQLTPMEREETGLQRLSSDQLAILDALIRRDEQWYTGPGAPPPSPTRFSQRLSPEESKSVGLDRFDEAHRFRLDVVISRIEFGEMPVSTSGQSPKPMPQPTLARPGLEIHGMVSFTVGGGTGGYSEMGGSIALMLDDPAHNLSVFVDYEEMHAKGPLLDRGCHGDPNYRAPLNAFLFPGR
jgi:hypothetical protein